VPLSYSLFGGHGNIDDARFAFELTQLERGRLDLDSEAGLSDEERFWTELTEQEAIDFAVLLRRASGGEIDEEIRQVVRASLGRMGNWQAIGALFRALENGERGAASALGEANAREVIPVLERLLVHGNADGLPLGCRCSQGIARSRSRRRIWLSGVSKAVPVGYNGSTTLYRETI